MEIYEETKNKFNDIQRARPQELPTTFNEPTINDIAKNFKPEARLFNSFYNGVENDKQYSYMQQVYVPQSYPSHFINTQKFSPVYLAMQKHE